MNDIVIIGAGGFGREVQWLIERINEQQREENGKSKWNILGYIDDGVAVGTDINGYKVFGTCNFLAERNTPLAVTCAVGSSKTRRNIIEKIRGNENLSFPNLIDPSVKMSEHVALGIGNIICADNILTVNIHIADFCIINLDCTVGHDARLSSFVTFYPSVNVSGNTYFGACVEIGTGTQIIQGKTVGVGTIVGAGSVVIHDLPDECTAVGSPCKPIKYHNFSAIGGVSPGRYSDFPVCAAA